MRYRTGPRYDGAAVIAGGAEWAVREVQGSANRLTSFYFRESRSIKSSDNVGVGIKAFLEDDEHTPHLLFWICFSGRAFKLTDEANNTPVPGFTKDIDTINGASIFTISEQLAAFVPDQTYTVDISVHTQVSAGGGERSESLGAAADVDPRFELAPEDQPFFQLFFSPNVSSDSIPEPATYILVSAGLIAIVCRTTFKSQSGVKHAVRVFKFFTSVHRCSAFCHGPPRGTSAMYRRFVAGSDQLTVPMISRFQRSR